MFSPRLLFPLVAFLLLLSVCPEPCSCLRCWVCGGDTSAHDTDPSTGHSGGGVGPAWCTTSVSKATCDGTEFGAGLPPEEGGVRCYKELWKVDGKQMVKRGCAKWDSRYDKAAFGCEEQITGGGAGGFGIVLCVCKDELCNRGGKIARPTLFLLPSLVVISKWMA